MTGRDLFPRSSSARERGRVNFDYVNRVALGRSEDVARAMIPGGRIEGREYVCVNPHRPDKHLGSLKINMQTGAWSDFSTGAKGGDLVSFCAFANGISQRDACIRLADRLGVNPFE
jgi:hypothetical protein